MTTQTIISEIETLPNECLPEIFNYIAFLRYRAGITAKNEYPFDTIVYADLEEGYKAMAADKEREAEAMEWVNAYMGDIKDE